MFEHEEEPWEADISRLLGGLPPVEPPQGFLPAAVDHRPLFAGRTIVGLAGMSAAVVAAALLTGVFDKPGVVLPVDALTTQQSLPSQQLAGSSGSGESQAEEIWTALTDVASVLTVELGFPE